MLSLSPGALQRKDSLWVTALAQRLTPEGEERAEIYTSPKPDSLKVKLRKIIASIGSGQFGVQFKDVMFQE